jgi:TM2 domain-containing membrane protein YozV
MALGNYLAENFAEAANQLQRLSFYIQDTSIIKRSFFLHALVLNELAEWDKAKTKLLELVQHSSFPDSTKERLRSRVNRIYNEDNYPNLRKKQTAKLLSALLPGTGQIYSGHMGDGIANVALQVLSIAFGGYAIYHEYYITGIILGGTAFRSFYMGGIRHLDYLVEKKNHELKRTYNDSLKPVIMQIEKQSRRK